VNLFGGREVDEVAGEFSSVHGEIGGSAGLEVGDDKDAGGVCRAGVG